VLILLQQQQRAAACRLLLIMIIRIAIAIASVVHSSCRHGHICILIKFTSFITTNAILRRL
jgi:hypothetical protein